MHTTTISAKSGPKDEPEATPTPAPSAQPPKAAVNVPKDPPQPAPVRSRLMEEANQREAELQHQEVERNKKQLRTIFSHAKTVRRCLEYATKVLDRFDVSYSLKTSAK